MTRLAIASCCKIAGQYHVDPQPVWRDIAAEEPDLLLLLGDNVYMRQASGPRWDLANLASVYRRQLAEPHFAACIGTVPFMATWDDHDFGPNDGRGDSSRDRPFRSASRRLFHKYFATAINTNRPEVYCSHVVGDVKVILLDVRYYKTDLRHPAPTILGKAQEAWLAEELEHKHAFTVVGSGTGLVKGGPRDRWTAYKDAYARLVALLTGTPRTVLVTGDVHYNRLYRHKNGVVEVTSSGVGRARKSDLKPLDNYGVLDFDRAKSSMTVRFHGRDTRGGAEHVVHL